MLKLEVSGPTSLVFRSVVLLLHIVVAFASGPQTGLILLDDATPHILTFSRTWECLGPFRVGTREAIWGADPLEAHGGFVKLVYNKNARFRTPLAANASIIWSLHEPRIERSSEQISAYLEIDHADIDWQFMQRTYGWSALQYQTWTRGRIRNHSGTRQRVLIYPEGILEFFLNGQHVFGGDFFSFNRAPVAFDLKPGINVIDIRLIRDVRAMGGGTPPTVTAKLRLRIAETKVHVDDSSLVVPDLVDGRLSSPYMSITIHNLLDDWISVKDCPAESSRNKMRMMSTGPVRIAPSQARPIAMLMMDHVLKSTVIEANLCYVIADPEAKETLNQVQFSIRLKERTVTEAHKFTFLHASGAISYAVLQAPRKRQTESEKAVPLLLNLHGAGLEADSHQVRHMLDEMADLEAFALFPTGMSPWSGDDWHTWGLADVLAAINAVHDWIKAMEWNGTLVSTDKVLISGHSNGGQGTWFFATHLPDRTLAAAPASGYTSIENYVSYNLWGEADPLQSSVLDIARSSYRHELFVENLVHIPILQQHGSADENVPPYHSRLMCSLRSQFGLESDYVELPDKPHWWSGAMSTKPLRKFYKEHLAGYSANTTVPDHFSIVSPNSGNLGSKFSIVIDQLRSPDRLGRIDVKVEHSHLETTWHLLSSNIRRLHFELDSTHSSPPTVVRFDDDTASVSIRYAVANSSFVRRDDGQWIVETGFQRLNQRYGRQRGVLDAILRTTGSFQIVSCVESLSLALQVGRNMLQYYGADAAILQCQQYREAVLSGGNLILLTSGLSIPPSRIHNFPMTFERRHISLRSPYSDSSHVIPYQKDMGAAFLRPLPDERLELVVWGYDDRGVQKAARLVPTLTGAGQPDFVVLGSRAKWLGHGGVLAMGFFDYAWNISRASYLP